VNIARRARVAATTIADNRHLVAGDAATTPAGRFEIVELTKRYPHAARLNNDIVTRQRVLASGNTVYSRLLPADGAWEAAGAAEMERFAREDLDSVLAQFATLTHSRTHVVERPGSVRRHVERALG
jgi:hypothetical protein